MDEAYRKFLSEGEQAGMAYRIEIPRHIQRGRIGSRLGNRSGSSLEFMDHREYIPGDDLRRIDWNAFARNDKLSIKLFRDEVSPHVDILIDNSRSMALPNSEKVHATLGLSALFARAAANSEYTYTAWGVRHTCNKIFNGSDKPMLWDGIDFDGEISFPHSLRGRMPALRPQGIRVLLSDLLWMGYPHETLSILTETASCVFVVQILADNDVNPPPHGKVRLRDCESNEFMDIFIDDLARKRYLDNLARHQYNWSRACREFGANLATVISENVVSRWKLDELVLAEILRIA